MRQEHDVCYPRMGGRILHLGHVLHCLTGESVRIDGLFATIESDELQITECVICENIVCKRMSHRNGLVLQYEDCEELKAQNSQCLTSDL